MGQSKGGGYAQKTTVTPEQKSLLDQFLSQAGQNAQGAAEGFRQFLPGGGGGKPIIDQANKNFQQQTIPSIMNAFGSGAKSSSALNQALAAGASNLNTDIAAQIAQMQLGAAQGLGGLAQGQGQLGSKDQFAYLQRQMPFWQQLALAGTQAGGQAARSALGGGFG